MRTAPDTTFSDFKDQKRERERESNKREKDKAYRKIQKILGYSLSYTLRGRNDRQGTNDEGTTAEEEEKERTWWQGCKKAERRETYARTTRVFVLPRRFMKQVGLSQAVEEDRRMARANNLNGNPTPHPLCKN